MLTFKKPLTIPSPPLETSFFTNLNKSKTVYYKQKAKNNAYKKYDSLI